MIRKYLNCLFINKNNFKCSKCNTIFKNKNDFNKHLDDERLKILKLELQKNMKKILMKIIFIYLIKIH
jgi:uncharacterized C2H2 Zn-finger protein